MLTRASFKKSLIVEQFQGNYLKVIPQKLNLPMNFLETFPESSLLSTVSKKTIKMIGHHSRLRDMMGQSYPIYVCTSAYHAHYLSVHLTFCGSSKHHDFI